MTGDRAALFALYAVMLILPLSALVARRLPLKPVLKMALAWVAIFVVALLIASQRDRLSELKTLFADQQVSGTETRISMADDGHFWADVDIDGIRRRMLIDSGATTTALSTATAKAAGLDSDGKPVPGYHLDRERRRVGPDSDRQAHHDRYDHRDRSWDRHVAVFRGHRRHRYELSVEAGIVADRERYAHPDPGPRMNFT